MSILRRLRYSQSSFFRPFAIACGFCFIVGCTNNEPQESTEQSQQPRSETALQGSITVQVDNAVYDIISGVLPTYEKDYPQADVRLKSVSSSEGSEMLFGDDSTRIVILARDYLPQEREVMSSNDIQSHQLVPIYKDALVLFSSSKQTLPFVKAHNVTSFLDGSHSSLASYDSTSFSTPEIVSMGTRSSVYAHVYYQVLNGTTPKVPMRLFSTKDSVIQYAKDNPEAVAFGYLSWIAGDSTLFGTRIGWYDEGGNFKPPAHVHQSSIVTGVYPWTVNVTAYIRDEGQFLPYGYSIWMSRDEKAQMYFRDNGVVPEHARFVLKPE